MSATPKQETEALMNAILPTAESHLSQFQEFYPFGGVMTQDGNFELFGAHTGEEKPKPQELIAMLEPALKQALVEGRAKATALLIDIMVTPPGQTDKSDAVRISLDHASGYSVEVVFPYRIVAGKPEFGQVFAQARTSPLSAQ